MSVPSWPLVTLDNSAVTACEGVGRDTMTELRHLLGLLAPVQNGEDGRDGEDETDPAPQPVTNPVGNRSGESTFCRRSTTGSRNDPTDETTDPEVIIAEFDHQGRITAADRTLTVADIQLLRVRDGMIVAIRDYRDHVVLAHATGCLSDLVAALTADRAQEPT